MEQDGTTRNGEETAPPPDPAADQDAVSGRCEMKAESDERAPEEAGYGYGV